MNNEISGKKFLRTTTVADAAMLMANLESRTTKTGESLIKETEPEFNAEHRLHVLEIIEATRKSPSTE